MVRQFILTLTFLDLEVMEMVGRMFRQFILTVKFLEVVGVEACIGCDVFEAAQYPLLIDS